MAKKQQKTKPGAPKSKGKVATTWVAVSAGVAALALFLTNIEKIVAVTKSWIHGSGADHVLESLRVDCEIRPHWAKPGEVVTISVTPVARNTVIIPGAAVVIQNFSSINDHTVGSWVPETRGFTDANGVFDFSLCAPDERTLEKDRIYY